MAHGSFEGDATGPDGRTNERGDGEAVGVDRRGFIRAGAATTGVAVGAGSVSAPSTARRTDHRVVRRDTAGGDAVHSRRRPGLPRDPDDPREGSDRKSDRVTRKADHYASHGYVVLTYDSRGFGDSGGVVGLNGPDEVRDARTLIDRLTGRGDIVHDAAGDPRLGMDGYSYSGAIQLLTAAEDDRIDTVVPRITWNDLEFRWRPTA